MAVTEFVCTECGVSARSSKPIPAGARVKCPKCGVVNVVGGGPTQVTARPAAARAAPPAEEEPVLGSRVDDGPRSRKRADEKPPRRERPKEDDEDDEDEDEQPRKKKDKKKKKKSNKAQVIIGGVAVLLIVGVAVLLAYWAWAPKKDPNEGYVAPPDPMVARGGRVPDGVDRGGRGGRPPRMPEGPPLEPPPLPDVRPSLPLVGPDAAEGPASVAGAALPNDTLDRVKKATVYVRVTDHRDDVGSGSGFFAGGRDLVVTNAHVVGMKGRGGKPPRKIELVVNSGERDESTFGGRLIGFDRDADLAVIQLVGGAEDALPPPLTIAHHAALRETHKVWAFGFPLGEGLGKNVTVSDSTVSSLRRGADGQLETIQIGAGITRGNSGGPIVDAAGNVVGVSVSGISGTHINFAVPGERVTSFLRGRIVKAVLETATAEGDRLNVPVRFDLLDPLGRLKEVAVDWWVGAPGTAAPAAAGKAPPVPGGAARQTAVARRDGESAAAAIAVPAALPSGKVLWLQPRLVDGGGRAVYFRASTHEVLPPPAARATRLVRKVGRGRGDVLLESKATLHIGTPDGQGTAESYHITARIEEDTRKLEADGSARVRLTFSRFDVESRRNDKPASHSPRLRVALEQMPRVALDMHIGKDGKLVSNDLDVTAVEGNAMLVTEAFATQVAQSLDITAVPLPGDVQPGQTWKGTGRVPVGMLGNTLVGALDVTYTYRGVRRHKGAEVAVVSLEGTMKGSDGQPLAGRTAGVAHVDLASGRVLQVHAVTDVVLRLFGIVDNEGETRALMISERIEVRWTRQQ